MPAFQNLQICPLDFTRTPIQEFYNDTNVLVTGATGFIGKLLIEKLLRTCCDIKKIYLIVRTKKNKTPNQRIEELFQEPIFGQLEKEWPKFRQNIVILSGDCTEPNLGLSEHDKKVLTSQVNVVFHNAATVRFNEKLKIAATTNMQGTKNVLELCKQFEHLKAVVHVSTAYSQSIRPEIEEKFYPPDRDPLEFLQYINETESDLLDELTPSIIGSYPNTYSYTKALAEEIVRQNYDELPIVIVRPSIVIGAWKEPIKGWIDNLYGPTGLLIACGAGLVRVIYGDENKIADLVPVDAVVNILVTAAWDRGQNEQKNSAEVLNFISSHCKPITWGSFFQLNMFFGSIYPLSQTLWYCLFIATTSPILITIYTFLLHTIPGYILDLVLILSGKKPRITKIYEKIHMSTSLLSYYSLNQWKFRDNNVHKLWAKLNNRDKELFAFNLEDLDWDEFFFNNIRAIRRYIAKDDVSSLPASRKRMDRFKLLHYALKYGLICLFLYWMYNTFRYFSN